MKAVVFAAFLPNIQRSQIYMDHLKKHYSDCDVYIGLNSSFPGAEEYLKSNGFHNVIHVPKKLEVNSDASAFQAALLLLRSKNIEYETVYFTHTKGISYADPNSWMTSCRDYFVGFCERRNLIDESLKDPLIGGVSYVGRKEPMNNGGYSKEMDDYCPTLKQTETDDIMSLITMYGIRGNIVKYFIDHCKDQFYTTKLDRYFFETSFPLIVDKSGFKRHHLAMWD